MKKISVIFAATLFLLTVVTTTTYALTPKRWTFLIYVNGNNHLDLWGAANIKSMEKMGSNDQVNIVVQWASESANKAVRLLVQKSTNPKRVTSPILQDLGLVDMGDYHSLEDFIAWGVTNFPADHYFIDVWDHGSGWHANSHQLHTGRVVGDISHDDISGHEITTPQLGQVMDYAARLIGHKVDIYGSDACLMGAIEIAAEMSNSVRYYIGSQEEEPGAGWPYADLLSRWEKIHNANAAQIAKIVVDAYVKSYENGSNGSSEVTMSAYDLNKLAGFYQAIKKLGTDIRRLNKNDKTKIIDAAKNAIHFNDADDLIDFLKRLMASDVAINPQDIANGVTAVNDLVILNEDTQQYKNATGLSIWFPVDSKTYDTYAARYQNLIFNVNTQWNETLKSLFFPS